MSGYDSHPQSSGRPASVPSMFASNNNNQAMPPIGSRIQRYTMANALTHLAYITQHNLPNDDTLLGYTTNVFNRRFTEIEPGLDHPDNYNIACWPVDSSGRSCHFNVFSKLSKYEYKLWCDFTTDRIHTRERGAPVQHRTPPTKAA